MVFRVDASMQIGGGHVMRCLALADALKQRGAQCWFASSPDTAPTVPALASSGHEILTLDGSGDAESLAVALSRRNLSECHWLIVDHYGWDKVPESACRPIAEKILVIDDLADRAHDCDVLLDQTLGRNSADYDHLVPAHCTTLTGPSFALLRPEFAAARQQALSKREAGDLRRVLVSMGLTDHCNATALVLEGIVRSGMPLQIDVVLGSAAPHLQMIKRMAAASEGSIEVYENPASMSALMVKADIAFGAGGSSSWERCCLGLPSILIVIADNQEVIAAKLAEEGAAVTLGSWKAVAPTDVAGALHAIFGDATTRMKMTNRSFAICDGLGAERLAGKMIQ